MSACPPSSSLVVVAGLVLAVSAGARTSSSSKPDASPGLTSKGATDRVSRPATGTPGITLYDQYDNPGAFSTNSQNYEAAFNPYDDEARGRLRRPRRPRLEHRHGRGRRRVLQRPRPGDVGQRELLHERRGQPAWDAPSVPTEHGVHERPELLDPVEPSRVARAGNLLGLCAGKSDVQHNRPVGLARSHRDLECRVRLAEPERGIPAAALHVLGTPGDHVQHRSCFTRPGLQAPRHDRSASATASTATATAAAAATATTATTGRLLQRRGDHDPRLRARAIPYPSTCVVSGLERDDHRRQPDDQRLSHTYPDDIDILLVRPDADHERERDVGRRRLARRRRRQPRRSTTRRPRRCPTRRDHDRLLPAGQLRAAPTGSRHRPRHPRGTSTCRPSTGWRRTGPGTCTSSTTSGGDMGSITSWSLSITTCGGPPPPPPPSATTATTAAAGPRTTTS